ncbi:MAG: hypothetical protein OR994_06540 [Candidatus Poseidoniales archaeon]|nr:hypothetical protein [Candidatus Poseidoniales archaeon]
MTTIFKAVPEETEIDIYHMEENIRFIGNDVKSIRINKVEYGSILTLDEIDSLEVIHIKSSGAVIAFNGYPDQTIKIRGAFEEVRVKDKNNFYNLHRYASNPTLPLGNIWGAVITRDSTIQCGEMDALMLKTTEITDLKLDGEWSHISLIGDRHLQSIEVSGKRVINNIVINKGPALESLNIRRRSLTCSLWKCPVIDTIIGFGDRLNIHPKPCKKNAVSIGGFWYKVPEWYNDVEALLRIRHFKAHLTANDIITCDDLGGVTIMPYTYNGPGGVCEFSSVFELDDDDISLGIEISRFIQLIEEEPAKRFDAFSNWCQNNLSLFDQYKALRILASLITRGFASKPIINVRNHISEMNTCMPKLISSSVDGGNQGGKWNKLYSGDSDEWEGPDHSVMPFGRVDLEIWLNTNLGVEFLGMHDKNFARQRRYSHMRHLGENSVVRNILVSTLSAANTVGRNSQAELKLTNLAESLYTNPALNTDPFCCEFTIYHLGVSRVANQSIIQQLVNGIVNMRTSAWCKAALLVGIIDQINFPKARIALKRLASDKEFTVSESLMLNAISISGKRAFESGKVTRPKWPYLENWKKEYKNNGGQ